MARTAKKKNPTKSLTFSQKAVRWMFRPAKLATVAALAMTWLCWHQVERQLPALEDREEYQIGVEHITITAPPRWVPEDLVERVFARAGFKDRLWLQDPKLSEKIAMAFHTHPWIERLTQVRKSFPARVHVDVVYREPVAMVEVVGGGYLPVDRLGFLLPDEDFSAADIDRYPIIKDVTSIPIRRGESWGDAAVTGAAELAAVLTARKAGENSWWKGLNLQAIVVPRQVAVEEEADSLQFKLLTSGGSEILWGRSPSTQHPAELEVVQKLERMDEYYRTYNGFDSAPAPFRIDIRHWKGTVRTALTTTSESASRN